VNKIRRIPSLALWQRQVKDWVLDMMVGTGLNLYGQRVPVDR